MKKNLQLLFVALIVTTTLSHSQEISVSFDGNDFIEVPEITSVTGSNARSVDAWIKVPYESNS